MTTQQDTEQLLTAYGTMNLPLYDPAAMKVREALMALTRAWCEMHRLPQPHQTAAERNGEIKKNGHHNR